MGECLCDLEKAKFLGKDIKCTKHKIKQLFKRMDVFLIWENVERVRHAYYGKVETWRKQQQEINKRYWQKCGKRLGYFESFPSF